MWNQHKALFLSGNYITHRTVSEEGHWGSEVVANIYSPWKCFPRLVRDFLHIQKTSNHRLKENQEEKHPPCLMWTNCSYCGCKYYRHCHLLADPTRIYPLTCSSNEDHSPCAEQWNWSLSRQALSQEARRSHGRSSRGWRPKPWPMTLNPPTPLPAYTPSQEGNTGGKMKACWATGHGALQEWELCPEVYLSTINPSAHSCVRGYYFTFCHYLFLFLFINRLEEKFNILGN